MQASSSVWSVVLLPLPVPNVSCISLLHGANLYYAKRIRSFLLIHCSEGKILNHQFGGGKIIATSLNGGRETLSGISHKIPPSAEARVEFEIYDGVGVDVAHLSMQWFH